MIFYNSTSASLSTYNFTAMKGFFTILAASSIVLLPSCLKETHFGASDRNAIKSFTVKGQIGQTIFEGNKIYVAVDLDYDLSKVTPTVEISNFATISPSPADGQDFRNPVVYKVTSESGVSQEYTVWLYQTTPEIQLPNSGFQQWYATSSSGKSYLQIGAGATDTTWATGNAGAASIAAANVAPITSGSDTIAELATINTGKLAQAIGQGIAAGSLFTGKFKLNISNPIASAKFGISFVGRPKSFSVKYKYAPGPTLMNGRGAALTGKDSLDVYLLLEDRSTTPWKRVATAWFRSDEAQSDFRELKVNLTYGQIPTPKYYEIPTGATTWGTGLEKPTHITVVFSSSARGNLFEGAPGSKLWVNDFQLYY